MSNIRPGGGQLLSVAGMAEGAFFCACLGGGGGGLGGMVDKPWASLDGHGVGTDL